MPRQSGLSDELIVQAMQGSTEHVDELLRRFRPWVTSAVLGYLFRSAKRLETVADLTQETLAAIAHGLGGLKNPTESGLRSYTSGVIRNLVLGHQGRAQRAPRIVDPTAQRSDATTADRCLDALLETTGAGPATTAERRERVERLRRAVRELPENARDIVQLVMFEQLTTIEAAERLGIERSAAGMRFKRAMDQLRATCGGGGETHA